MLKELFSSIKKYFIRTNIVNTLNPAFQDTEILPAKANDEIVNLKDIEDSVTSNPINNPLVPFFRHYSATSDKDNPGQASSIAIGFRSVKTPMTKDEYENLFHTHINLKSFCNEEKFPILKKIYDDLKIVNDKLKPLEDLGLNVTMDLTGGAVRDFVLNKHQLIKDLDIMISFSYTDIEKISKPEFKDELLKYGFTSEQLDSVKWNPNETDNNKFQTQLVQLCFLDNHFIKEVFQHTEASRSEEHRVIDHNNQVDYSFNMVDRLSGIIKLNKSKGSTDKNKTNFEIDLLVTDLIKPAFMAGFDINLCKASFCLVNKLFKKTFPKDASHLISRFSAPLEFFADFNSKKITINVDMQTNAMLDNVINGHLDRVLTKYPGFEPNFIGQSHNKARIDYAKNGYFAKTLAAKLNEKEEPQRKLKI